MRWTQLSILSSHRVVIVVKLEYASLHPSFPPHHSQRTPQASLTKEVRGRGTNKAGVKMEWSRKML